MTPRRHKRRCKPYVQSNICNINDGCIRRVYLACRQISVGALEDSNVNYFLSDSDGNLGSQRTYHAGNTNPYSCWSNSSHTYTCRLKDTPDATKNSFTLFFCYKILHINEELEIPGRQKKAVNGAKTQLPVVGKMKIRRKLTMLACIIVFLLLLIVCSAVMVSLVYQQKSESEKKLDDEEQMEYLHNLKSSTKNGKSPVDKKLS